MIRSCKEHIRERERERDIYIYTYIEHCMGIYSVSVLGFRVSG